MEAIAKALVAAQKENSPESRLAQARAIRKLFPPAKCKSRDPIKRLLSKVVFTNSDCWLFVGHLDAIGYGRIPVVEYGENKAHRVAYRAFVGPIPEGQKVLHKCDTRCCVNPSHLFIGTQADNVADMCRKKRNVSLGLFGEENPMSKLTKPKVEEIRRLAKSGEKQIDIARSCGVSPMTISRVVRGESWT